MCCAFLILVTLGPRVLNALWWLLNPLRWQLAFQNWPTGLWWMWPVLGIVFVPWMTLMYVLVAPGGVTGLDWLWIGLGLVADIASYGSGARRKSFSGYSGI